MSNSKYQYTIRSKSGNGYVTAIVNASHHDLRDKIIYFGNQKDTWHYLVALENLIDITSKNYVEVTTPVEVPAINSGTGGPIGHAHTLNETPTILPKEHT